MLYCHISHIEPEVMSIFMWEITIIITAQLKVWVLIADFQTGFVHIILCIHNTDTHLKNAPLFIFIYNLLRLQK